MRASKAMASKATTSGQREIRELLVGLGCISEADTYRRKYPIFTKIGKNQILGRYVSAAYDAIYIGYVSDTRYGVLVTYPCNIAIMGSLPVKLT